MEPWHRVVTLRKEVREGRSFSPDEFAIALEQVVDGTAPDDYRDANQFFARTCFTRALSDHIGMVLRRLTGETARTAPVVTMVTQFGGGKTHTLTALYHLAKAGDEAGKLPGVGDLLQTAGVAKAPPARVGVFVGNAWDPGEGEETPWIALARQLAGDDGVAALGTAARSTPPGTDAIARMFAAANGPVLLLFDEVLNFVNRHRSMAEQFHAFIQNLTVAVPRTTHAAAVISLPRSQVEMTSWDQEWQEKITKVVRRVAQDLIANDEEEIGEVVRRRLFEDLGAERIRKRVAKRYAQWCFEHSAFLPPEWTSVDTASSSSKAKERIEERFLASYPFHPATLSVFQRKWRALSQYQQTRGTLAMLAQWISAAAREHFQMARQDPLITLGSAPLHVPEFCAAVLGQLGEARLTAAIDADLAGDTARVKGPDADTSGAHWEIHRRVGTAVLFESSGGQVDKVAHLPELRFALGGPNVDTTTVDTTAATVENVSFFIRRVGTDGYRIHHKATLKKVVSDRRASLDEETEIQPAMRRLVETEFGRKAEVPTVVFPEAGSAFPEDSSTIPDLPKLRLVVMDPETEWQGGEETGKQIAKWTRERGKSPRRYPAALIWCVKKPGRDLRDRVETWLAWQHVQRDMSQGILGAEFDQNEQAEVNTNVKDAEAAAYDEVWGGYRFAILADPRDPDGFRTIDLGAGHSSTRETLCGRVVTALKTESLLNESIGVGYLERQWPPAFNDSGAWPLTSLRQSFLDGSLTRLLDPDAVLREKIVEFVRKGSFGLGSGQTRDGGFQRLWFVEDVPSEEVAFDEAVFLVKKENVEALREPKSDVGPVEPAPDAIPGSDPQTSTDPDQPFSETVDGGTTVSVEVNGAVPPESWNRLGTRMIPKLRSGTGLKIEVQCSVQVSAGTAENLETEIKQTVKDLGLQGLLHVKRS